MALKNRIRTFLRATCAFGVAAYVPAAALAGPVYSFCSPEIIEGELIAAAGDPTAAPTPSELPPKAANPGWLGVALENTEVAEGQRPQVRVKSVFRDAPAGVAGVQAGDIVLEVGGVAITGGTREMVARVQSHAEGTALALKVDRGGETREITVNLGKLPEQGSLTANQWKGRELPPLALLDLDTEKPIDLKQFRGEVLVIDMWATWCGPCRASMPKIEKLQQTYAARGLRVIGVSDEERPIIKRFVDNRGIGFKTLAFDPKRSMASEMYISSYPTYIVVDTAGVVQEVFRGTADVDAIGPLVESLLPPVAP